MDYEKFNCVTHGEKKINFFCTANQWHFVPLCSQCIPQHTQNHSKSVKVNLQSFQKVWEKHCSQKNNAIVLYQQKLTKIQKQLQSQEIPKQYQLLTEYRQKCINVINKHFDQLTNLLDKKTNQTKEFQKDLMNRLKSNVQADISQLNSLAELKNVSEWAQQAKRIYFKDNMEIYCEEIQELVKQHRERIYERNDLSMGNIEKIQSELKDILSSWIVLQKDMPPPKQQKKQKKETKKSSKVINKPKVCKNCGGQLKYLTEWKKHLVCPTCGGKQRNYIQKPK